MTAEEIIEALNLTPHPEGGWYCQTWRGDEEPRPAGTCIYYLLKPGEESRWHRVDATEIWHFYAGTALTLGISATSDGPAVDHFLGPDLAEGQVPQIIVPAGHWQTARSGDDWSLVGCTVSPGFRFEGFEMAPDGFDIPRA